MLSGDSSSGPDSLIGKFYQVCWEIVGSDVIRMVYDFFFLQVIPFLKF